MSALTVMMRKRARAEWLQQSEPGQELLRLRAERGAVMAVHARLLEERDSLSQALGRSQEQLKDAAGTIKDGRRTVTRLQRRLAHVLKAQEVRRRVVVARDGTRVHFPQRPPE